MTPLANGLPTAGDHQGLLASRSSKRLCLGALACVLAFVLLARFGGSPLSWVTVLHGPMTPCHPCAGHTRV